MEMTPAQVHKHLDVLLSAGKLLINMVGEPGAQGAGTTGTQGTGVKTPEAAVVAVATAGFVSDAHIPKGRIFTSGM